MLKNTLKLANITERGEWKRDGMRGNGLFSQKSPKEAMGVVQAI